MLCVLELTVSILQAVTLSDAPADDAIPTMEKKKRGRPRKHVSFRIDKTN